MKNKGKRLCILVLIASMLFGQVYTVGNVYANETKPQEQTDDNTTNNGNENLQKELDQWDECFSLLEEVSSYYESIKENTPKNINAEGIILTQKERDTYIGKYETALKTIQENEAVYKEMQADEFFVSLTKLYQVMKDFEETPKATPNNKAKALTSFEFQPSVVGTEIFAEGYALVIQSEGSGTTVYMDDNANGILDSGEQSLKEAGIANAPENGADLSTYVLYGGSSSKSIAASPHITMMGGELASIIGAGSTYAVSGDVHLTIGGTAKISGLYGGGYDSELTGSVYTEIKDNALVNGEFANGGVLQTVTGDTHLTINGGTLSDVYGGGFMGTVNGSTYIEMNAGTVTGTLNGGASDSGGISKNTNVIINGGTVQGIIYGGCYGGNVQGNVNINITGGIIDSYVNGLGHAGSINGTKTVRLSGNPSIGSKNGTSGILLNNLTDNRVIIDGPITGNANSITLVPNATSLNTVIASATDEANLNASKFYMHGYPFVKKNNTLVLVGTPTIDTASNSIYASGVSLYVGQEGSGTTIYVDQNQNGQLDEGELSLKDMNIANAPANGADLSAYTLYGGSASANITASPYISMMGGNLKSIFGAGIAYAVTGDVHLNIGGTANVGSVYGGGFGSNATVSGNSYQTVTGGKITNKMYGGGYTGAVKGTATQTISGGEVASVSGNGEVSSGNVTGVRTLNISGGPIIGNGTTGIILNSYNNNIVNITGAITSGEKAITFTNPGSSDAGATIATAINETDIKMDAFIMPEKAIVQNGKNIIVDFTPSVNGTNIYGEGSALVIEAEGAGTTVYIDSNRNGIKDENEKSLKEANVFNAPENGADLSEFNIFGGAENSVVTAENGTRITMNGGNVSVIYGGGKEKDVIGNTYININGESKIKRFLGGGMNSAVDGSTYVDVQGNITATKPCYGGGGGDGSTKGGNVTGDVNVNINGGTYSNIYGSGSGTTCIIEGDVNINIENANTIGEVYSAGYSGAVNGNVNFTMSGGTISILYGSQVSSSTVGKDVNIKITGGTLSNLYGAAAGKVNGNVNVEVTGGTVGSIYGGGSSSTATIEKNSTIDISDNASVTNVYGGGGSGAVKGTSAINITGGAITGNVSGLGSSSAGNPVGTRTVNISGNPVIGLKNNATGIMLNSLTNYRVNIVGELTGNIRDITLRPNATKINTVIAIAENEDNIDKNKFFMAGSLFTKKDKTLVLLGAPTVDATSKYIYASGAPLYIDEEGTGTTIYIDENSNGIKDAEELSLKEAGIANAPENGADLSTYVVFGGSATESISASPYITMMGGKLAIIYGAGNTYAVTGDVHITVGGTATITNSVYGAGLNAALYGSVYTEIKENATITGSAGLRNGGYNSVATTSGSTYLTINGGIISAVYGAGYLGNIGGSTYIEMNNGTVNGNVYAGAYDRAGIAKDTHADIHGGTIKGNLYGGSWGGIVNGNVYTNITGGSIVGYVTGDGSGGSISGTRSITLSGNPTIGNKSATGIILSTYSSNRININGVLTGAPGAITLTNSNNTSNGTIIADATNSDYLDALAFSYSGKSIAKVGENLKLFSLPIVESSYVYAEGNALLITGTSDTSTTIYIDINANGVLDAGEPSLREAGVVNAPANGANLSSYRIYGGSKTTALTCNPKITMTSGKVYFINGGGNEAGRTINGDIHISLSGTASVSLVVSGGTYAVTNGSIYTEIKDDVKITNTLYNGGDAAAAKVNGDVKLTINGGTINSVYGGGQAASVGGSTYVEMNDGVVTDRLRVGSSSTSSIIDGSTHADIRGGKIGTLYGGTTGTLKGDANINITGGTINIVNGSSGSIKGSTLLNISGNPIIGNKTTSGLVINTFTNNKITINGALTGNPEDITITSNSTPIVNSGAIAVHATQADYLKKESFISGSKFFYEEGETDLRMFDKPSIDGTNIYGNGNWLFVTGDAEASKTTVYVDLNRDGVLDDTDLSLFDTQISNAPADNADLSTYHIYGGSNTATVEGDTYVTFLGGKITRAYGGGGNTNVNGDTHVIAKGNAYLTTIYAGSNDAAINGSTYTSVSENAYIDASVYAGGAQATSSAGHGIVTGDTRIDISGGRVGNVYGGGFNTYAIVSGNSYQTITGGKIANVMYGGGYYGAVKGNTTQIITGGDIALVSGNGVSSTGNVTGERVLNISGNPIIGNTTTGAVVNSYTNNRVNITGPITSNEKEITLTNPSNTDAGTIIATAINNQSDLKMDAFTMPEKRIAQDGDNIVLQLTPSINGTNIYAEGTAFVIEEEGTGTTIYIDSNRNGIKDNEEKSLKEAGIFNAPENGADLKLFNIYGGAENVDITVENGILITMNGGEVAIIYGGGNEGDVVGDTHININGVSKFQRFYGGGMNSAVDGSTNVDVQGNITASSACYGGGEGVTKGGNVTGDVNVNFNGGTYTTTYGGGKGKTAIVEGDVNVNIQDGNFTSSFYVGGFQGSVNGNTNFTMTGGTNTNVYGTHNDASPVVGKDVNIKIAGGKVLYVFGAGTGKTNGNVNIEVTGGTVGTIYGGGSSTTATIEKNSTIDISDNATVTNIYGGGSSGAVKGTSAINITGGTITGNVSGLGSSSAGNPVGTRTVNISGNPVIGLKNNATGIMLNSLTNYRVNIVGELTGNAKDITLRPNATKINTVIAIAENEDNIDKSKIFMAGSSFIKKDNTIVLLGTPTIDVANKSIYASGAPLYIDKEGTGTTIYIDENNNLQLDEGESSLKDLGVTGAPENGADLSSYIVYGGSATENISASPYITMMGGKLSTIYGAGNTYAVTGDVHLTIGGTATIATSVYGAGLSGVLYGSVYTEIKDNATFIGSTGIRNAGYNSKATVTGSAYLTINGGTLTAVYGAGSDGPVNGSTYVEMNAGTVSGYFNGGAYNTSVISQNTNVTITGGTINNSVFGGCYGGTVNGNANITITGGTITGSVSGLGVGNSPVKGTKTVTVSGNPVIGAKIASKGILLSNLTNNRVTIGGPLTGNPNDIALVVNSAAMNTIIATAADATNVDASKFYMYGYPFIKKNNTLILSGVPYIDTANNTIYATGAPLYIDEEGTGTTIYIDVNMNGQLDPGECSLKELGIANAPADGANLSAYTLYGGSINANIAASPYITMMGGKLTTIYGAGKDFYVVGDVHLTLGGTATVSNAVYGAGNTSVLYGSVYTEIKGDAVISGSGIRNAGVSSAATVTGSAYLTINGGNINAAYGAGYDGTVNESTYVEMNAGTVKGSLNGGAYNVSLISQNANVTINGGTINGNVYAGCYGGTVNKNTNINITGGTITGFVTGVGNGGPVNGTKSITISGNPVIGNKNNNGIRLNTFSSGKININAELTSEAKTITLIYPTSAITGTVIATSQDESYTDGSPFILLGKNIIKDGKNIILDKAVYVDTSNKKIFAEGFALLIKGTSATASTIYIDTNRNGVLDTGELSLKANYIINAPTDGTDLSAYKVYGGSDAVEIDEDTLITMDSGSVSQVYGGGGSKDVTKDTYVNIKGTSILANIIGGGELSNVEGNTNVYVSESAKSTGFNVGGGLGGSNVSNKGIVKGNTNFTVDGGTHQTSFGGGRNLSATVEGNTYFTVNGGTFTNSMMGGGWTGSVVGSSNVVVNGGTITGYLDGGGKDSSSTVKETHITINGGKIGNMYAAGEYGSVLEDAEIIINDGTISFVRGGGLNTSAIVSGNSTTTINGGTITYDVYAGGANGSVKGDSIIHVKGGTIKRNISGNGSNAAGNPLGTKTINISGNPVIGTRTSNGIILNTFSSKKINIVGELTNNAGDVTVISPSAEAGAIIATANELTWANISKFISANYLFEQDEKDIRIYPLPSIDTASSSIYANGNAIIIQGTSKAATTIYVDSNRNGNLDSGEKSLKALNVTNAPVDGANLSSYMIYGGSNTIDVITDTKITAKGGSVNIIYGGGNTNKNVQANTDVTVGGNATVARIYGGSNTGYVAGNTNVLIKESAEITSPAYGGGYGGVVKGDSNLVISGGKLTSTNYGGGYQTTAAIEGNINVTINGGSIQAVYGAGYLAPSNKNVNLEINGGEVLGNVSCGGNNASSKVLGNANFTMSGGTIGAEVIASLDAIIEGNLVQSISGGTISNISTKKTNGTIAVNGEKTINISGNPIIGNKTSKGIDLQSYTDQKVIINDTLTGEDKDITLITSDTTPRKILGSSTSKPSKSAANKFVTTNNQILAINWKTYDLIIRPDISVSFSSNTDHIEEVSGFSEVPTFGENYSFVLQSTAYNYDLPSSITIRADGDLIDESDYSYDEVTGSVELPYNCVTGDLVVEAIGRKNSRIITYDINGGKGDVPEKQEVKKSTSATINFDTIPTRDFYLFTGWSATKKAVNEQPDYKKDGVNTFVIEEDTTLYATWKSGKISCIDKSADGIKANAKFKVEFLNAPVQLSYGVMIGSDFYLADLGSIVEDGLNSGYFMVTVNNLTAADTFHIESKINDSTLGDAYAMDVTMPDYNPEKIYFDGEDYTVHDVFAGLSYSINQGVTWIPIKEADVHNETFEIKDFDSDTLWIYRPGNANRTDSDIQKLSISKETQPEIIVDQPIKMNQKGVVTQLSNLDSYSIDNGVTWEKATKSRMEFDQGQTILIRTNGSKNTRRSDIKTVTIDTIKELKHTITQYTGIYDGLSHNALDINVSEPTSDVTIRYGVDATNLSNEVIQVKNVQEKDYYYEISAPGYETVSGKKAVSITKKTLTATYVSEEITYGNTPQLVIDITGFENNETQTSDSSFVKPQIKDVPVNAGIHELTPVEGNAGKNYIFAYDKGTLNIHKANLNLDIQDTNVIYDGQKHGISINNTSGATMTYRLQGETEYKASMPSFKDVGTYVVEYRAVKENYEIVENSKTITISPKTIIPTIGNIDEKIYDGTTDATGSLFATGVLPTEKVTLSGKFIFDDQNAGTSKTYQVQNIALSGDDASNYELSAQTLSGTSEIKARKVEVEWQNTQTRIYDGTNSQVNAIVKNVVNSESATLSISNNTNKDAGTYTASIIGIDNSNYSYEDVDNITKEYIIEKRELNYLWQNAQTKVYDGQSSQVNASLQNVVSGDDATLVLKDHEHKNVGTYRAEITGIAGNQKDNYKLPVTGLKQQYEITPALLSAVFTSKTIIYENKAEIDINVTGFVNGETKASLGSGYTSPTYQVTPTIDEDKPEVGTYTVTPEGGSAKNYTFSYTSGVLDVNKATMQVNVTPKTLTYDRNEHSISLVVPDVSGTTIKYGASEAQCTLDDLSYTNAGTYTIYYKVTKHGYNDVSGSANLIIQPKEIEAKIKTVENKTYDGNTEAIGSLDLDGVISEDKSAMNVSGIFSFADKDAGESKIVNVQDITLSDKDAANKVMQNYHLKSDLINGFSSTAKIKKAQLNVSYAETINYTETPTGKLTISGFVANENETSASEFVAPTLTLPNVDPDKGHILTGLYEDLEINGGVAKNYTFQNEKGTLSVFPTEMEGIISNYRGVYDGLAHKGSIDITKPTDISSLKFTYSVEKNGSYSSTVPTMKDAGTYKYYYKVVDTNDPKLFEDFIGAITVTIDKRNVETKIKDVENHTYDGTRLTTGTLIFEDDVAKSDGLKAEGTFLLNSKDVEDSKSVEVKTISLQGDIAKNFILTNASIATQATTAKVLPKKIGVTWHQSASRVYDGTASQITASANDIVAGDTVNLIVSNGAQKNVKRNADGTVGKYEASASIDGNKNYTISSGEEIKEYQILPKQLTITNTGETITYGETPLLAYTMSGFISGENENVLTNKPVASIKQTTTSPISVGTYTTTTTGGTEENYSFHRVDGSLLVQAKALDLNVQDTNVTYDGKDHSIKIVKDDGATLKYRLKGQELWSTSELSFKDAGEYEIEYLAEKDNYISVTSSAKVVIEKKIVDAQIDTINNKAYDGTTNADGTLKLNGVITEDKDKVIIDGKIEFLNKSVGKDKDIKLLNLVISGAQSGNYILSAKSISSLSSQASIEAKELTLTWSDYDTRTYDGSQSNVQATLNGVLTDENVTLEIQGNTEKDAGSYTAVANKLSGTDASHYKLPSDKNKKYTIDQKEISLDWKGVADRSYNGLQGTIKAEVSGVVNSDDVLLSIRDQNQVHAGTYTAKASIGNNNYKIKSGEEKQAYNILKKELTVTYAGESVVYGTSPTLQLTITGFENGEDPTNSTNSPLNYIAPRIVNTNTDEGSYVLKASSGSADDYSFAYVEGTLKISPALMNATVSGYNGIYNGLNNGVSVTKLDGSIITYSVDDGASYTATEPSYKDVGTYKFKYQIKKKNYADIDGEGQVVIHPKTVMPILSSVESKTYDGTTDATGSLGVEGVIPGDIVTIDSTFHFDSPTAENNKFIEVKDMKLDGENKANYVLSNTSFTVASSASVRPRTIEVSWDYADSRVYDGKASSVQAKITNLVGDDIVAMTISNNTNKEAGKHFAKIESINNTNYTLNKANSLTQPYTIQKREAELVWQGDGTTVYDGQIRNVSATVKNIVEGDSVNVTVENGSTNKNVGTYTAIAKSVSNANYQLPSENTKQYKIDRAELKASISDSTIEYGSAANVQIDVDGFVSGEDETNALGYKKPIYASSPILQPNLPKVGVYTLTPKNGSATNYKFTYVSGELNVNGANLNVKTTEYNGDYDGSLHNAVVKVSESDTKIKYGMSKGTYDLTTMPKFKDADDYIVYFKVEKENYNIYEGSVKVHIGKKEITPSLQSVDSKVYDGTSNTTGKLDLTGVLENDEVIANGMMNFVDANAGENKGLVIEEISLLGKDAKNYKLDQNRLEYIDTTASIDKATLRAKYISETIPAKGNPVLLVEVSGFMAKDNEANITGYQKPRIIQNTWQPGNSYTLTPVEGDGGQNYIFEYQSGILTIQAEIINNQAEVKPTSVRPVSETKTTELTIDKKESKEDTKYKKETISMGKGEIVVNISESVQIKDMQKMIDAVLTKEQKALVKNGSHFEIRLNVEKTKDIKKKNQTILEKKAKENQLVIGEYYEVNIEVKEGNSKWLKVKRLNDKIQLILTIPKKLQKDDRTFYALRMHDEKATVLEDKDNYEETLTIVTDEFSTYAIAYEEKETTSLWIWITIFIIGSGFMMILYYRRKRNHDEMKTQ